MKITKTKIRQILDKEVQLRYLLKIFSTIFALVILWTLYNKGIVAPIFVNGEPITLSEILRIVQEEGGPKNAFDRLILEKIVEFEARKHNIIVAKEEIDIELKKIEEQALANGKTLIQLLEESDQNVDVLEKNVKLRITLYKILEQDIDVSEEEIDEYIDNNKELYEDRYREEIREEVKELLLTEKFRHQYEKWINEAKAQTEIDYLIKI